MGSQSQRLYMLLKELERLSSSLASAIATNDQPTTEHLSGKLQDHLDILHKEGFFS